MKKNIDCGKKSRDSGENDIVKNVGKKNIYSEKKRQSKKYKYNANIA